MSLEAQRQELEEVVFHKIHEHCAPQLQAAGERTTAWVRVGGTGECSLHNGTVRSLRALAITLTEESAMAAAAITGESSSPKNG
jgi:hypothetical protein